MTLLIGYLLLALGVSFLCSLTEASILSISRARVGLMVKEGKASGRLLEMMKRNIDRPLSAILTLNTIAHTVGAAGVGAEAQRLFGETRVAIISAVLTLLILILSEIIPKTLGAVYSRQLAGFTAYTVQGMIVLTYPFVLSFQVMSKMLAGEETQILLTRKEFAHLAELGLLEGALNEKEFRLIRNVLRVDAVPVREVMTPRTVVAMLHKDIAVQQAAEQLGLLRFSRTPIYGDGPDEILGLALRQDVYERYRDGKGAETMGEIAKVIHAVPETASVGEVLYQFLERKEHMFLVVDEYGGTAGIITLEDAVETLLGQEIMDETDEIADMRALAGKIFQSKIYGRRY